MSEVTPPPPSTPPSSAPTVQPTVVVSNPPAALVQQLALGAKLEAVIAQAPTKGQIEIDTPFGRITIQTTHPLPSEGPLQLQLLAKGPQLQFLISAIHGLPPAAALRALGLPPPAPGAGLPGGLASATPSSATTPGGGGLGGATAAPGGEAVNLTVGATLSATLLRPGPPAVSSLLQSGVPPTTPGGQAIPAPTPGATPGTGNIPPGQIQPGQFSTPASTPAINLAAPGGPAQPGAVPVPGAAAGNQHASQTPSHATAQPASGTAPALLPGTLFGVRITAFQPAAAGSNAGILAQLPTDGALAPGNTLQGIVVGRTVTSGQPIVQTHWGSLVVATRTPLPPGSSITFEVLSQAAPTAQAGENAATHGFRPAAFANGQWPALAEAIRTLEEINPAAAQQLIHAVMPRPGAALAGNMLFFLVAVLGGNLRGWIGDGPARILQKTNLDLFERLQGDFSRIKGIAEETRPGSDWRTTYIPIMNGAEIEQIRLYMRPVRDENEEDENEGAQGTRFVIELDLSRLGRFQLDGLVHQKGKHMDLIVRTEQKLAQKMQTDIRDIFTNAIDVTGIKGGIVFQAAPPNFVEVAQIETANEKLGLIV